MQDKIFVIGLPKTGTTSLHHALEILGFRSIHFPHDGETVRQIRAGDYNLKIMQDYDAASDIPIPALFPQLDTAFPGSRFILTWRPLDDWLASHKAAPFNSDPPKCGSPRDFYRALLYGVTNFSEERFRWVYEDHHARVERYFAGGREADLLRLDIGANPDWEVLCTFLDKPVPTVPFPHSNRAKARPQRTDRSFTLPRVFGR